MGLLHINFCIHSSLINEMILYTEKTIYISNLQLTCISILWYSTPTPSLNSSTLVKLATCSNSLTLYMLWKQQRSYSVSIQDQSRKILCPRYWGGRWTSHKVRTPMDCFCVEVPDFETHWWLLSSVSKNPPLWHFHLPWESKSTIK